MKKYCSECGKELQADDKFCLECGTKVIDEVELKKENSIEKKSIPFEQTLENIKINDINFKKKKVGFTKHFNEDYKEYLSKIICKDKIMFRLNPSNYRLNYDPRHFHDNNYKYVPFNDPQFVNEDYIIRFKVIEGIDSIKFLNENVSIKTYVTNGEFLLDIRLEELLYHKLFDDIKYIYNKLTEDELEADRIYIVKLYLDGEKDKSRNELEKFIIRSTSTQLDLIFASYCFRSLFNDSTQASNCLEKVLKIKEGFDGGGWGFIQLNKIFELLEAKVLLLNDFKETKHELLNSETKLVDGEQALMWSEIFNDDREVKKCIKKYEEASHLNGLQSSALLWKILFNDDENALRCLQNYEKYLEDDFTSDSNGEESAFEDWNRLAPYWKLIFNNEIEARRCLEKAGKYHPKYANNQIKMKSWAKNWALLFKNDNSLNKSPKLQNSEEDIQNKIKNYLNLANMELQRVNKNILSRIYFSGSTKKDRRQAEYYLNEAIKLGSKEAEKRLSALKYIK